MWWRRAVLPSLPWVVRFLSFFYAVVKFFYARTKEFRDITRISRRVERNFITCAGTTPGPAASRKMILRKLPRLSEHRGLNFRIVLFGWGWGRWVVLFWVGLFRVRLVVGAKGEVSTSAAHASGRPPSVFLASPPSKACAMRSPASSEQRDRPSGLLCGRLRAGLRSGAALSPLSARNHG